VVHEDNKFMCYAFRNIDNSHDGNNQS
jgi:hypothetical protein